MVLELSTMGFFLVFLSLSLRNVPRYSLYESMWRSSALGFGAAWDALLVSMCTTLGEPNVQDQKYRNFLGNSS